jgi:hypothetical protein
MGKTTAVTAFIAALHRTRARVALTVASSQVQALAKIRDDLLLLNVSESLIGLKHALPLSHVPSTGNESRQFQLVTHVRARSATDEALVGQHDGRDRALVLYDETLWRTESESLLIRRAKRALAYYLDAQNRSPLAEFLAECNRRLPDALDAKVTGHVKRVLTLPSARDEDIEVWCGLLERDRSLPAKIADQLVKILRMVGAPVYVVKTGQGHGLVSVKREHPPAALRHVAILDASSPIRYLVSLDSSITQVDGFAGLKSFENVAVFQRLTAGGRESLESRQDLLGKEILHIVQEELVADSDRCFLIVTFKPSDRFNLETVIRHHLSGNGVNLGARRVDGSHRFQFLHWGMHEGVNGFEHCNTVILAGVLTRDQISIAAAIKAQTNPRMEVSADDVERAIATEIAHCVYQAASRGSCRRVQNGMALGMNLHVLHKDCNLRKILAPVMPGAVWQYTPCKKLPPAEMIGKTTFVLDAIVNALESVPTSEPKISSVEIKRKIGLPAGDRAAARLFTRAAERISPKLHGWKAVGRSFAREN